ncbi:hypothetical protein [Dactylosporangium sp. NPDC049140]|uniref:hypothetical protein n=1 Tax=Dactylosporangium sp. NPDC049140 TaxID=3155647 RepID=UPI0034067DDC
MRTKRHSRSSISPALTGSIISLGPLTRLEPTKRRTEPAFDFEELPPLDGVVVFHLRLDRFDREARRGPPCDMPVVSTQPASSRRSLAIGRGRDRRGPSDTSPALFFDMVRHGVRPGLSSFDGGIPELLLFRETSRSSCATRSVNSALACRNWSSSATRVINCRQSPISSSRDSSSNIGTY